MTVRYKRLVRMLAAALVVTAMLCPSVIGAAAPPPLSLAGEMLSGVPLISASCDFSGTSTITFTVTGTASGPYPGTFSESGTVTIGPQGLADPNSPGEVTSFAANYVIKSGKYTVTGSMQLTTDIFLATNQGFCNDGLESAGMAATYTASTRGGGAPATSSGKTSTAFNAGAAYPTANFSQFFSF